jgi:hypothetical protein
MAEGELTEVGSKEGRRKMRRYKNIKKNLSSKRPK